MNLNGTSGYEIKPLVWVDLEEWHSTATIDGPVKIVFTVQIVSHGGSFIAEWPGGNAVRDTKEQAKMAAEAAWYEMINQVIES